MQIAENYPPAALSLLMNFLSTHDTARALTVLGASREPGTREERAVHCLSREELRLGEKRFRLAAFLQYVLPGIPCIFYGDEIGTEGWEDPFCRRFMDWEKKSSLPDFFRSLAAWKRLPALKSPAVRARREQAGVVSLERGEGENRVVAVVNATGETVPCPKLGRVLFSSSEKNAVPRETLEPFGFVLAEL